MTIDILTKMLIPTVVIICLVVGYLIKHMLPIEAADRWIPLVVALLGAVLACIVLGISLDAIAAGLISGLGSVGFHQLIKQLMGGKDDDVKIYKPDKGAVQDLPSGIDDDPDITDAIDAPDKHIPDTRTP